MIQTINLKEIKQKIIDNLKESGWSTSLQSFFLSEELDKILEFLLKEVQDGKRFTPELKYVFNAFQETPVNETKVIFIGTDPYSQLQVANGRAFCCGRQGKMQKALETLLKSVNNTVYEDKPVSVDPDLLRWSKQGVLLLNSALTVVINNPGTHHLIWKEFMLNVLDYLVWNKTDLAFVFFGKKAAEFYDIIPDNHLKIKVMHPAAAGYSTKEWDSQNLFNRINDYLISVNKSPINW